MTIEDNISQSDVPDRIFLKIVEGIGWSSCVCIGPEKFVSGIKNYYTGTEPFNDDVIAIDEDDFTAYLEYFFQRHCKRKLQIEDWRRRCFDFYNKTRFSFASIKGLVKDIRKHVEMLANDFSNPTLFELKRWISYDYNKEASQQRSLANADELIRKYVNFINDFYDRFCKRMEKMMYDASGCNIICVTGP